MSSTAHSEILHVGSMELSRNTGKGKERECMLSYMILSSLLPLSMCDHVQLNFSVSFIYKMEIVPAL